MKDMRRLAGLLCASVLLAGVPLSAASVAAAGVAGAAGTAPTVEASTRGGAPAVARAISPARLKLVGTLIVPRLRLRAPIYSGNTDAVFDVGLGHWPGTAIPGNPGNAVIGGHRTGGRLHLRNIHLLKKGDRISAKIGRKTFNYKVTTIKIVRPNATSIVKRSRDTRLTLYTCHPPHSIKFRYVVTAVLAT